MVHSFKGACMYVKVCIVCTYAGIRYCNTEKYIISKVYRKEREREEKTMFYFTEFLFKLSAINLSKSIAIKSSFLRKPNQY